ncbi:deoxyuridine 5'-triphosphate nucleotidohydrolase [Staphylococcus phage Twort]|uniref:dUTP diphosphatase n=2 Tax=Staphylococcus phage Twort (strain DSM 17442 / HER 48) TaxID=2908167 RepID=A0A6H0X565_BPTWO|nr:dUTPase [Staphylococcus phage Twort]AAX92385.1 ORF091 [Staphylococcus phage Twort]QIW89056.1 deoxyuridine 5'-triphosphate nucleotidohydrolase [Staphylococcus phage Twort]
MENLEIKLLHKDAKVPVRANMYDSGLDLYAVEDIDIKPCSKTLVSTGIAINLPTGYEAQVRPKSGITAKTNLRVQFGSIDFGYNLEIKVMVDNIGGTTQKIEKGKKIAQLVIAPVVYPKPVVVEEFDKTSERGGFGSTGLD